MNKKYCYDILLSAQVNRYIFLVVYEPYRVLEGLQGVGFQGHFLRFCKAKIDIGEVWAHFYKAIFTLKSDTLQAL